MDEEIYVIFSDKSNNNKFFYQEFVISKVDGNQYELHNSSFKLFRSNYRRDSVYGWYYKNDRDKPNYEIKNKIYKYRVFIKFTILPDQLISRWAKCIRNNGQPSFCSHVTISRLDILDNQSLINLLKNKNNIRKNFTDIISGLNQKPDDHYKILGENVPLAISNIDFTDAKYFPYLKYIFNKSMIPENKERIEKSNKHMSNITELNNNKEIVTDCYLVKVFYQDNFRNLYNEIHKDLNPVKFSDLKFYEENDYDNFIVHLSLAKFSKIGDALKALHNIYNIQDLGKIDFNDNFFSISI